MNAEVIKSLSNLADTLSKLDERQYYHGSLDGDDDDDTLQQQQTELVDATAALSLSSKNDQPQQSSELTKNQVAAPPNNNNQSITYWRNLPTQVQTAYTLLTNGADYIHATSTKFTLVSKVDSIEGANLSLELRKGAQHVGTGTLLLFSGECGSSRSLRHYVKQSSRGVILSLLALLRVYEEHGNRNNSDASNSNNNNTEENVAAQKTGAVWSACDALRLKLPRGNRTAMRRELMIWVRDCNESVDEFEEMLELGPRSSNDEDDEEEQFEKREMKMARAAVNVMKCSKNTLGLVLKVCECVGESLDETQVDSGEMNKELLQMISDMHEVARRIGEGVTNFGVMLYPPLEAASNDDELAQWESVKESRVSRLGGEMEIPSLGSTSLGLQLEQQLYSLAECVLCIKNSKLTTVSGEPIQSCYSNEVNDAVTKLMTAIPLRCKEAVGGVAEWSA